MMVSKKSLNIVRTIVHLWEKLPNMSDHFERNDLACFIASDNRENLISLIPRAVANGKTQCLLSVRRKYPNINTDHYFWISPILRAEDVPIVAETLPHITPAMLTKLALRGKSPRAIEYIAKRCGITSYIVVAAYLFADEKLIDLVSTKYCYQCRRICALYAAIWNNDEAFFNKHFGKDRITLFHLFRGNRFASDDPPICCDIEREIVQFIDHYAIYYDRVWIIQRIEDFEASRAHIIQAIMCNSYRTLKIVLESYYKGRSNYMSVRYPLGLLDYETIRVLAQSEQVCIQGVESRYSLFKRVEQKYGEMISRFDETVQASGERLLEYYEKLCNKDLYGDMLLEHIDRMRPPSSRFKFIATVNRESAYAYYMICYAIVRRKLMAAKYLIAYFLNTPNLQRNAFQRLERVEVPGGMIRGLTCSTVTYYCVKYVIQENEILVEFANSQFNLPILNKRTKREERADTYRLLTHAIEQNDIPVMQLLLPFETTNTIWVSSLREEAIPIIKKAGARIAISRDADPYLLPLELYKSDILDKEEVSTLISLAASRNHRLAVKWLRESYPNAWKHVYPIGESEWSLHYAIDGSIVTPLNSNYE